jgi:hypothetical protein
MLWGEAFVICSRDKSHFHIPRHIRLEGALQVLHRMLLMSTMFGRISKPARLGANFSVLVVCLYVVAIVMGTAHTRSYSFG